MGTCFILYLAILIALLLNLSPTNFCLVGDLNARIGEKQVLNSNLIQKLPHINEIRFSKDKIVNRNGKRLMDFVDDLGGIVLNGRTNGDASAEFSFCGGGGSSVIDYCICSHSLLSYIDEFSVACKPYSDH